MAECSLWGRGVWKEFRGATVLRGADWEFRGPLTLLWGPNGSGKTTLLSISLGVYRPSRGEAGVCVEDRRRLGFELELREPPLNASVAGLLRYTARLRGFDCRGSCVRDALERVGLPAGLAGKALGALSSGQLKLVMLAQALLGDPEVIVLDEPFANLDPEKRLRMSLVINEAARDSRVVVASHIVAQLEAGEAYTIRRGRPAPIPPPPPRNPRLLDPETGEIVEAPPEKALSLVEEGLVVID